MEKKIEAKTELIFLEFLNDNDYTSPLIKIEPKSTENALIHRQLKDASKKGTGNSGFPEYIIRHEHFPELVIVVECKADKKKHISKLLNKPETHAVDGAIWYAEHLSRKFDVISIGFSGIKKNDFLLTTHLTLKNSKSKNLYINEVLTFDDYLKVYNSDEEKKKQNFSSILSFTTTLNSKLNVKKIREDKRCIVISGILLALKNQSFKKGYKTHKSAKNLIKSLLSAISEELDDRKIPKSRVEVIDNEYSFMKMEDPLIKNKEFVIDLITEIDEKLNGFIKTYKYYDVLGEFYVEFLSFANSDKGLGIVLTPSHIADLFCEMLEINEKNIVYDNCCGTGTFLISAMQHVLKNVVSKKRIDKIKSNNFIGVEYQSNIFTLACSNMIVHGDGLTKIIKNDCFLETSNIQKFNPNVGILNPPFKSDKKNDTDELEYVLNNLETLQPNSKCIALLPMRCALYQKGEGLILKEKLMNQHTLEAVCSLPNTLFQNSNVNTVTCAMVFIAHKPHNSTKTTYLGYWKNDGFDLDQGKRRDMGNWNKIKEAWLFSFKNKITNDVFSYRNNEETPEIFSVNKVLEAADEWCAEPYLKTNYDELNETDFEKRIKKYFAYKLNYMDD